MHMVFLSRGFKNLQWYSMTRCVDERYNTENTARKCGVFASLQDFLWRKS